MFNSGSGGFSVYFSVVFYKRHKIYLERKSLKNAYCRGLSEHGGAGRGGARSQPGSGTGTESVSVMGNTPGPGCLLGAVKITTGRTESNSNKRRERAWAGKTALMRTLRCIPGDRETQKCKQARSRD